MTGGFRAALNANWLSADLNKVVGVSLNSSGKLVKGTAGQSGFVGVVCLNGYQISGTSNWTGMRYAGDIVDVMQDGEIVEMTGLVAGTPYYALANGDGVTATNATGLRRVGWTVEATRLIVRCQTDITIL